MRSWSVFCLLCNTCVILHLAQAQTCDIRAAARDRDFPDIAKTATESFEMSVEYTLPEIKETSYHTEYYHTLNRQGRVESRIEGKLSIYMYKTDTLEAWEISPLGRTCVLQNISKTPSILNQAMNEWWYFGNGKNERRTLGPSAMFKYALDTWNGPNRPKEMGYMGTADDLIRGRKAQFWRRCDSATSHVDYFFTVGNEEDSLGTETKLIPLRVYFGGLRRNMPKELSRQQFEIMNFQPYISPEIRPFQLPVGLSCRRGGLVEPPKMPDFIDDNLQFQAEVVYIKINYAYWNVRYWSYYSTIQFAMDQETDHLAYYYTPWNSTGYEKSHEPLPETPEYTIYDMKHEYAYKTSLETGQCDIIRSKSYSPKYELPNKAGAITLTDLSILFPNSELTFISEGETRGLKVNIFEETIGNYTLDENTVIPKAVLSHSYLKKDEEIVNNSYVAEALVQIQMRFYGREDKEIELLTINFFGFSTQIENKRTIFNVQRCFKNDDDYSWVTLGFNADNNILAKIRNEIPSVQSNVRNMIKSEFELNDIRIPTVLVDFTGGGIFITLVIYGKPPIMLDYLPAEDGKTITDSTEIDGVQELESCAFRCLEEEEYCWGFSICGKPTKGKCTYGVENSGKVINRAKCQLYRRYNNETFIPSRESMIQNMKEQITEHKITLVIPVKGEPKPIQIDCTSIVVKDAGGEQEYINRTENNINPRMRVVSDRAVLKVSFGKPIWNLGKLSFEQCQQVCLDNGNCETISYCFRDSQCVATSKYEEDIMASIEMVEMCSVLTRKYMDRFNHSSGNFLSITAEEEVNVESEEQCAKACLMTTKYSCLSFDYCPEEEKPNCRLHSVRRSNPKHRESAYAKKHTCGHYYKKFSLEFNRNSKKRVIGSTLAPITNLTLEDCSKVCVEFGKGTCYGFDFCQNFAMLATSCVLFDTDPSQLMSTYSDVCTNYLRASTPKSCHTLFTIFGYVVGIGFLCFIIGLMLGCLALSAIICIKGNRQ